jgi:hypothetical protein
MTFRARAVLQHNGSNGMNLCKVLVDLEADLTIFGMTNIGGEKAEEALSEIQKSLFLEYRK